MSHFNLNNLAHSFVEIAKAFIASGFQKQDSSIIFLNPVEKCNNFIDNKCHNFTFDELLGTLPDAEFKILCCLLGQYEKQ